MKRKRSYFFRAIRHRAFLGPAQGVLFILISYLPLYLLDPEKIADIPLHFWILYAAFFLAISAFSSYKVVSGQWSANKWIRLIVLANMPIMCFYGYIAAQVPDYRIMVGWVTVGASLAGIGFARRIHFVLFVTFMTAPFLLLSFIRSGGELALKDFYFAAGATVVSYWLGTVSELLQKMRADSQKILIRSRHDKRLIAKERSKSDDLLLNILPETVANELKEKETVEPLFYESVSVLFTDFVGFTKVSESMPPDELVQELDGCFTQFDEIIQRNGLEKLKTIGDAYMCAGGLPETNFTHPVDICLAAVEMQAFMEQMRAIKSGLKLPFWELRLGINTGPVTAGVVGKHKFAYDIWGDTVNTASRMESSGKSGKVNISGQTYELVRDFFDCKSRGKVTAKGKGRIPMYFVNRIKVELSEDADGRLPNEEFRRLYAKLKAGELQFVER